jgi:hypothetical protein
VTVVEVVQAVTAARAWEILAAAVEMLAGKGLYRVTLALRRMRQRLLPVALVQWAGMLPVWRRLKRRLTQLKLDWQGKPLRRLRLMPKPIQKRRHLL